MARTRSFSSMVSTQARREADAARRVERMSLRSSKTGGGDIWGIIKGGISTLLGGGGGPSGPSGYPGPTGWNPPPPRTSGGGGGACARLPSFLQEACRNFATGGTGGGGGGGGTGLVASNPCPSPLIRNPITGNCIDPTALPPGGRPAFVQAGGQATEGAFGLPAMTPAQEQRTRLSCPSGMVLGKDNLCYPKAILSRRSRFRKWRPAPRAKITAAEWRTLKRAARVRDDAKDVAQEAGFKVTKK